MKLELAILAGAESKAFLVGLTQQIDRLEKLSLGTITKPATKKAEDAEAEEIETAEEDDEFTAPAKKKTAAKKMETSFLDDDDAAEIIEEGFTTPAPVKKAKKVSIDDVNDACKARAAQTGGKEGRNEVLTILKKKFKTTSVSEIKPEQFAAVIEAMQA